MFCQSCGTQVNGAFCANCGKSISQAPAPAQGGPVAAPPGAVASSAGTKIILIIVGVFVAFGILGSVALMYVGHKVKQVASDYGIDASSTTPVGRPHSYNACDLLSKDEASQILGTPIASSKVNGTGVTSSCDFYPAKSGNPDDIASAVDSLKKIGDQPDSPQKAGQVQDALTRMAKGAITDQSAPILTINVNGRDGRSNMAAFAGAYRIMAGITKQTGMKTSEDLSGIGDRAVLGAIGNMMFLKGDTSVELAGPAVLGSKDAAIGLARRIASRL
jgi:hypothetical protein